jgi:CubicO group peptidase (beta-lactamase class C family)
VGAALLLPRVAMAQGTADSIDAAYRAVFEPLAAADAFSGGVVVARGDTIEFVQGYGLESVETARPITRESVFELASAGKAFTAMAIMVLHDRGALDVDDPVQRHLPAFPFPGITLRHLLTHTSGLPNYTDLAPTAFVAAESFVTNADILRWLEAGTVAPASTPATRFDYSNTNYVVLACVVEAITGAPFAAALDTLVLRPLGMAGTRSYTSRYRAAASLRHYAVGYARGTGGQRVLPANDPETPWVVPFSTVEGDGTVVTTLPDLVRWRDAWTSDVLVGDATRREALSPMRLRSGEVSDYGFGWYLGPEPDRIYHRGGWPGTYAQVSIDLARNILAAHVATILPTDWSFIGAYHALAFR